MSSELEARLEALHAHISAMNADERAVIDEDIRARPEKIFDDIAQGDAMRAAIALENGVSPILRDADGKTPLHSAAALDAKLCARVLLDKASSAPWERDRQDRLPLDVAQEAGNEELANMLEAATYPSLYRDQPDAALPKELLADYDTARIHLGNPRTMPTGLDKIERQLEHELEHQRDDSQRA